MLINEMDLNDFILYFFYIVYHKEGRKDERINIVAKGQKSV
jgi:hypothetical protein